MYSDKMKNQLDKMKIYEKEYRCIKTDANKYALEEFKSAYKEFKEVLKNLVQEILNEKQIPKGVNMYESILKIRYEHGIFRRIDIELLLELLFEEGVLCDKYKYDDNEGLFDFYINNEEQFELIVKQVEKYEKVNQ